MSHSQQRTSDDGGRRGALVISLDFELHWGVYDHCPADSPYRANLLGARRAIPRLLDLFEEFGVAATWATVGFLFAESRDELLQFAPERRPSYRNEALNPYAAEIGHSEADDPLHFAPSLIAEIRRRPFQEIGCHTFSHYYCLESGGGIGAFRADIESAVRLARRRDVHLTSLVFPRNQITAEALAVLPSLGFKAYRGGEQGWMYNVRPGSRNRLHRRVGRFLDQYGASISRLVDWEELDDDSKLSNVRGSLFLRPFLPSQPALNAFRFSRIARCMRQAAATGRLFHLWWHPHNFGSNTELNLAELRRLLMVFAECRNRFGFRSISMAGAASAAHGGPHPLETAFSSTMAGVPSLT
ncbi:MAG TPA: polysaccharide deacetylase family protein [Bryobacteraceae bacterium]|nr:polysaccharide deacetylase family protein [Bryobacteraceae bacterium]